MLFVGRDYDVDHACIVYCVVVSSERVEFDRDFSPKAKCYFNSDHEDIKSILFSNLNYLFFNCFQMRPILGGGQSKLKLVFFIIHWDVSGSFYPFFRAAKFCGIPCVESKEDVETLKLEILQIHKGEKGFHTN